MKDIQFSLAVLTYNSELTINETLDSIAEIKGRENLQLIISDDQSQDTTVQVIEKWISKNENSFKEIVFRKAETNEGISANHTHAFELATGTFGLYLGGDDLIDNKNILIQLNDQIREKKDLRIARLRVREYYPEINLKVDFIDDYGYLFAYEASRQFRFLASVGYCFRSGPGFIFHIPTLKQLNYFGTYNRMFEDYQLVLRFTNANFKIHFLDIDGILWRRHRGQGSGNQQKMMLGLNLVRHREITPNLSKLSLIERVFYHKKNGFMLKPLYWYRDYFKNKAKKISRRGQ